MVAHSRAAFSRIALLLWIVGGIVLLLIIAFGIQVWGFYRALQHGDRGLLSAFQFTSRFTVGQSAAASPTSDAALAVATTDDPMIGSETAPVQVVEFADFGCPFSKEESYIVRETAAKYPDVVRFQYRDFPIEELHPGATVAAQAAQCANAQGKFWAYHDKLFGNQDNLATDDLKRYAKEAGLDGKKFNACLDAGTYKDEVQKDHDDGVAAGVRGTPTFFINGIKVEGAVPADAWEQIVSLTTKK